MEEQNQSKKVKIKRVLEGEVVSDSMDKTAVVRVVRTFKHPVVGKIIKRFKKYKAHDEHNIAKMGNYVEIIECRPISKTKHMRLVRVLEEQGK